MYHDGLFQSRNQFLDMIESYFEDNNKKLISLNAEWGNGKTFFIEHLMKKIGDEQNTIYIDCWEYQGSRSEETILIDAVFTELNKKIYKGKFLELYMNSIKNTISDLPEEKVKGVVKKSLTFLVALGGITHLEIFSQNNIIENMASIIPSGMLASGMLTSIDFIKTAFSELLSFGRRQTKYIIENKDKKLYEEYDNYIVDEYFIENQFYEILYELLFIEEKKVLVIFDELDRCEPDYAMNIIKKIKYINKKFNDIQERQEKPDGDKNEYNILISVNKIEFIHIMKHYYGEHYTAEAFFDKLFDNEFELPKGDDYKNAINSIKNNFIGNNYLKTKYNLLNKNVVVLLEKDNYRNLHNIFDKFNDFFEKNNDKLNNSFHLTINECINNIYELIFSILVLKEYSYSDYYDFKTNILSFGGIINLFFKEPSEIKLIALLDENLKSGNYTNEKFEIMKLNNLDELTLKLEKYKINVKEQSLTLNYSQVKTVVIDKQYILTYILFKYYNL